MRLTDALRAEYLQLFHSAVFFSRISEDFAIQLVNAMLTKQRFPRPEYAAVAAATNIPWHVIAIIHRMEADADFSRHLHNGDPLSARTVRHPAGRPSKGQPPFSWQDSAIDALQFDPSFRGWRDFSLSGLLFFLEKYNGFGYRNKGIATPYLWSGLNHYRKGKWKEVKVPNPAPGERRFKSVFDPELVSEQIGAAAMLKVLADRKIIQLED